MMYMNSTNVKFTKNILLINHKLFAILVALIPLYLFQNSLAKLIGYFSLVVIFVLCAYDVLIRLTRIRINITWLWFLVFTFYSLCHLLWNFSNAGAYSFMLQTTLLLLMCMLSSVRFGPSSIKSILMSYKMVAIVLSVPAFAVAMSGTRQSFLMFNAYFSPVIYKLLLPCSFFFLYNAKQKLPWVLFFSLLFLRMVERTSAIVILIIYLAYLILKRKKDNPKFLEILFPLIFTGIFIFVFIYIELQFHPVGSLLNQFFRQYTGGNFFSGRQNLWGIALHHIKLNPLLGYGFNHGLLSTYGINLSFHNTYIHLLVQGGFIGIGLFYLFLNSVWRELIWFLDDELVCLAAAYLIGILVFINFEVTMIGNTVSTALYFWVIFAMALARCKMIATGQSSFS